MQESKIAPDSFGVLVTNLLTNDRRREQMAASARAILPHDAAGNVADEVEKAVREAQAQ